MEQTNEKQIEKNLDIARESSVKGVLNFWKGAKGVLDFGVDHEHINKELNRELGI